MADRSVSLIDGGWLDQLRTKYLGAGPFDLVAFANRLVPKHHWRFRTYYFDALPYKPTNNPTVNQVQKYDQKRKELAQINRLERFTVREGYVKERIVSGYLPDQGFQQRPTQVRTREQKMVDVLLAVELTRIAWSKEALHLGLVAGDGDYVAAVRAAKDAGAIVRLFYHDGRVAQKLYDEADERVDLGRIFTEIKAAGGGNGGPAALAAPRQRVPQTAPVPTEPGQRSAAP